MNKITISFVLTSIVFFILGYTMSTFLGVKTLVEVNEHVMENHDLHTTGDLPHEHSTDEHTPIDLTNSNEQPTVELIVHEDPKSGWNLQVITTNFTFSPESASLENTQGEGHAHLYIDGTKITRLYGEWYHLPELTSGMHEITVSLNANDHSPFIVDNQEIADTEMISA